MLTYFFVTTVAQCDLFLSIAFSRSSPTYVANFTMADKVNMSLDEIIKASKNRRDTEASGSRKSFPKKQVGV